MRIVLFAIILYSFFVMQNSFAQPRWTPTDFDYGARRSWTFYKKIEQYPYIEFKLDTLDTTNYFDCNYYHFFTDTAFPSISYEDSVKCAEYMKWRTTFSNRYKGTSYSVPHPSGFVYYLPYIKNEVDTFWSHKLIAENKTFTFKSLSASDLGVFIDFNAGFVGRIIAKRYSKDTTYCLYYNNEYIIEVLDIVHSYFPLQKGDKLLTTKRGSGFLGGCGSGGSKNNDVFVDMPHASSYAVGDTFLFLANRIQYQFMAWHKWYEDKKIYCPQKLDMGSRHDYNMGINVPFEEFVNDVKLFFNTKYHER